MNIKLYYIVVEILIINLYKYIIYINPFPYFHDN